MGTIGYHVGGRRKAMRIGGCYFIFGFSARPVPVSLSLLLLAALPGGCMTLGDPVPPPVETKNFTPSEPHTAPQSQVVPQPRPHPGRPATAAKKSKKHLHEASRPKSRKSLAAIDPASLIGMESAGVQKLLGAPAHIRRGGMSREWVYSAPGCSFQVFFYPNLNSTMFRALKYGSRDQNGQAIDNANICIRHILTERSDGTG